ncbi:unnamed protein product [Lactuca saligna]|uniref:Uncharacterized protein n=1 Tax=Lactuca saligna TaxID=75948 RepID=A0AA36E5L4_LACSI|nr:unnamed protein product [Lactuca saligna]
MDDLTLKEEKCKVLEMKLQFANKQVDDFLAEKTVTRSCIFNVTGLLYDIIETRDPMIFIIVKKHLVDKLRSVFAMLHHLEGVSQPLFVPKKGKEGSSQDQMNVPSKVPVIPLVI